MSILTLSDTTAVGKIMVPEDVHILISEACENVTFPGKRGSAGVIKLMTLRQERLSLII